MKILALKNNTFVILTHFRGLNPLKPTNHATSSTPSKNCLLQQKYPVLKL